MPDPHPSLITLFISALFLSTLASPVDFLLGQEYHGQYVANQPGVIFTPSRKLSTTWMNGQAKSH
jgi:hypothetical protein